LFVYATVSNGSANSQDIWFEIHGVMGWSQRWWVKYSEMHGMLTRGFPTFLLGLAQNGVTPNYTPLARSGQSFAYLLKLLNERSTPSSPRKKRGRWVEESLLSAGHGARF